MDSAPAISPSSEERLWNSLRDRVDSILEDRKRKIDLSSPCGNRVEWQCGKRFREDSQMLMRGFESVNSSLIQLSSNLNAAQQGLSDIARPSVAKALQNESEKTEGEEPNAKKLRSSDELEEKNGANGIDKPEPSGSDSSLENNEVAGSDNIANQVDKRTSPDISQNWTLKKAKNLATSMATKAASLARELKSIRAELRFMQERCNLLEEENSRLREGLDKGVRPEEDDLVRLQLEALLAEKSRLANENANLTRENQCLHQLVEYHQLTALDLSASYDQSLNGICLDFSSPSGKTECGMDNENDEDNEAPSTPCTKEFELLSSCDEQSTKPQR